MFVSVLVLENEKKNIFRENIPACVKGVHWRW